MFKNRKKSLTRKIMLGMLAASVLYGGAFVSQAEAAEIIVNPGDVIDGPQLGSPITINGGTINADVVFSLDEEGKVTISGGDFQGGNWINGFGASTLDIKAPSLSLTSVTGFSNINFYIPKTVVNGGTILTLTGTGYEKPDLTDVTINAGVQDGSSLKTGDTVTLINAVGGIDGYDSIKTGKLTDPGYLNYDLTLNVTENTVKATIGSASGLSADSKSLAETRAGGIAILNDGATLMAGTSLINAKAAAHAANLSAQGGAGAPQPAGFTPFAAMGANNMRYNTGSHVDSKGWGINVGMARELNFKKSVLTIAPLIEYGRSNYDSYLDSGTHGSGKQQFLGVGTLVRQDFAKGGVYVEGSLRAGHMKGDYSGIASYDTSSNYFGLHAGLGKIIRLNPKNKLDVYGKLFYTHQAADHVTLSTGAEYDFATINSFRTRLGTRWTTQLAKLSDLYVGLAWDHEFDSDARASYKGYSTPTPGMKGDSGMLELGWQVKPKETSPLSIDLNLTGWCGKQRGVQFGAGFDWSF